MSTAITLAPQPAPTWQARILNHSALLKTAISDDDFLTFRVVRALEQNQIGNATASPLLLTADATSASAKQDLDNLNVATVGTLQNKFGDYTTDTQKLKDDANPDKDSWIARIQANGDKLKQDAITAIDNNTAQGIATINNMPGPSQEAAANVFMTGRDIVANFVGTIASKIQDILGSIGNFFKGIWDSMLNAVNAVKDAAESAWHSITGIFSFALLPLVQNNTGVPFTLQWSGSTSTAQSGSAVASILASLAQQGLVASSKSIVVTASGITAQVALYDIGHGGEGPDKAAIEQALQTVVDGVQGDKPTIVG